MASGWTFGKISLPKAPRRIIYKMNTSILKVPQFFEGPMLMSLGTDTKILSLEGEFFEGNDSLSTIYKSYCKPIEDYAEQKQVVDELYLDEAPATYWTLAGVGAVCKNTGDDVVRLNDSLYVEFSNANGLIYRDFSENKDLSDRNLISLWIKGTGSEKFKVSFYNEVNASKANGYRFYAQCSSAGWNQTFVSISSADYSDYITNTTGTPTGWDKIRSIEIAPSNFNPVSQGYRFDAFGAGQGWKLNAPGTRYDGIYAIQDFQVEEGDGNIRSFRYRLTLMNKSPQFGEI